MTNVFRKLGSALKTVAPTLAAVVTGGASGPIGAVVAKAGVQAAAEALGVPPDTSDTRLTEALAAATPDQLAAVRKADEAFREHLARLEVDALKVDAADRADARARQVAMRDRAPFVLAAVTVTGFFAIFATLVFVDIPAGSREAMLLMIGAVTGALASVMSYFFGSSTGSKRKEEQVGDLLRRLGDRAP